MYNLYSSPEKHGLTTVGEIEWGYGDYSFDLTVVWKTADGKFLYAEDSGCSCPSPFDETALVDLRPVESLAEFKVYLETQRLANISGAWTSPTVEQDIAQLLESMHLQGAR